MTKENKKNYRSPMERTADRRWTEYSDSYWQTLGFTEGKPSVEEASLAVIPLRAKASALSTEIREMSDYILDRRSQLSRLNDQIFALERVITPTYKVKPKPKKRKSTRRKEFKLSPEDEARIRGLLDKAPSPSEPGPDPYAKKLGE